jgi:hypothetical protein
LSKEHAHDKAEPDAEIFRCDSSVVAAVAVIT